MEIDSVPWIFYGATIIPLSLYFAVPPDESMLSLAVSLTGLGVVFSGIAPLTKEEELNTRAKLDASGRILLGTGLACAFPLFLYRNNPEITLGLQSVGFITIVSGAISLGIAQDVGKLVKW
jgi:hypothetical protein